MVAGIALVLPFSAAIARADPTPIAEAASDAAPAAASSASELYAQGLEAFNARRYAEAIEKFRASFELSSAPLLLYNIAQAYRLDGDCARAVAMYRAFLATDPTGKSRDLAAARVSELEPCSSRPPASIASTPEPGGPAPEQPPNAGTSAGATSATPGALPAPRPPRSPPPLPPPPRSELAPRRAPSHTLGAVLGFGASIALVSVGGYFGWRAQRASTEVERIYARHGKWSDAASDLERSGQRDEKLSVAGVAGGLLAGGVTLCWLAFD